ncbi:MAG: hypothetical protein AABW73_00125 [Nanoarchaeota archaeon]
MDRQHKIYCGNGILLAGHVDLLVAYDTARAIGGYVEQGAIDARGVISSAELELHKLLSEGGLGDHHFRSIETGVREIK